MVEAIFASVEAFSGNAPPDDDRSAMVVAYPAASELSVTAAFPRPRGMI